MNADSIRHATFGLSVGSEAMLPDDFSASLSSFYDDLRSWLTTKTLGGTSTKVFYNTTKKTLSGNTTAFSTIMKIVFEETVLYSMNHIVLFMVREKLYQL